MKKSLPRIQAERNRLQLRLITYEQRIKDDVAVIKTALRPLEIAKTLISKVADSFRDNSLATQGTRLALTMLPRRARHPLIGIAAQLVIPLLLRNLPSIVNFVERKSEDIKESRLAGRIENVVDRIRARIADKRAQIADKLDKELN